MAKVKGPLLSMRASGSIAKTNVFASWRGIPYARIHVIPTNPRTAAQLLTRAVFALINSIYRSFGPISIAPWYDATLGRPLTSRNAFIKANLTNLRTDEDTSQLIGSNGSHGGPALASFAAVTGAGSAEIDVTMEVGTLPTGWALVRFCCFAVGFQDVSDPYTNMFVEDEVAGPSPGAITLTTPAAATQFTVTGWAEYTRPDGSFAYSPASTDDVASGA